MKNFRSKFIWILFFSAVCVRLSAQLIVQTPSTTVPLTIAEAAFVQKIAQLADTKSSSFVSIGDIAQYAINGDVTFSVPGITGPLSTEALRVEYNAPNDYVWSGRFKNQPGYFSIIAKPEGKVGFFQTSTQYFSILPVNSEVSLLKETDLNKLSPVDCVSPSTSQVQAIDFCEQDNNDCFSEIDLLVLVTPDVQTWFEAEANPWQALLTVFQGIEGINLAFANSGIVNKRIRWSVERFIFDTPEDDGFGFDTPMDIDDDIANDLPTLAAGIRNERQADIVIMLTSMDYPGIAGIAQNIGPDEEDAAYAIVEIQSIADPRWTFAHEFAHLLGAQHNRSSNCSMADVCGNSDDNTCAHGWLFNDAEGNEQRTIMARMFEVGAMRIPHYSNPDIDFNNAPTGTTVNDNSRIIRNAACIVDDYNHADWSIGFTGSGSWRPSSGPIQFNAVATPPNAGWGLPGNPPYQYKWEVSCSPTFNNFWY